MEYAHALIALVLGGIGGYLFRRTWATKQLGSLEEGHADGQAFGG